MNERQLLELKEDIEKAKQEISELKGQKKGLMKQLKEDWGCETLEQAQEQLESFKEKQENTRVKIDDKMQTLVNKYDL